MSSRPRPARALLPLLALALAATGCQLGIASAVTTGPGDPLTAGAVPPAIVTALGLDGVGDGPVAWWSSDGQAILPADSVHPLGAFEPATGIGVMDVVHVDVAPARDPAASEVVLRPAWSTRVDATATGTVLAAADQVTVSFATPGSPGQHPEDDRGREVVDIDTSVEVAAGTCEDVIGLQVWQVGPPTVEAPPGALQADYLGWVLARTPCA